MDKNLITSEITKAMREHDKIRLGILRLIKNEIETREKDTGKSLTDEEVVSAFKKVLKQTGETLEGSIKADTNAERTALLQQQIAILEGYLPKQVTGDELAAVVDRVLAAGDFAGKRDMGKVIGLVGAETGGNCDKAEVAKIVGAKLV
ncbi:MAG: glutamyl-tRNA amidotransferase [Actinobacteria bacterium HGW-Actinobacteria-6]|jgi:hypothetical protein|nr:MAG: glutamyl-tRNA amidotransferase [Actinobacteria bacterium HGW-Actinobacteria-6]